MKRFVAVCFFLIYGSCCLPGSCIADIYKYVDEKGVIHFTNTPTDTDYRLIIKKSPGLDDKKYDHIIKNLCRKYRIDTALVKAVIRAESAFDPYAISKKGAQGLMQLMPHKARELNVDDPFHPRENLQGGISYLSTLLNKFNRNVRFALAAYNAGENVVMEKNGVPPYKETQNYIEKVLRFKKYYQTKKYIQY